MSRLGHPISLSHWCASATAYGVLGPAGDHIVVFRYLPVPDQHREAVARALAAAKAGA
jgi:hypothetical protein